VIKIRVVSCKSDIDDLTRNDQTVHISFRASSTDMFRLLQLSPRLRTIQVPPAYYRNMPQTSRVFLETQGVEIIEGDLWGYRKDIDTYYTINDRVIRRIGELLSDGLSAEEISNILSWDAKLSPAMVKHIIKEAVIDDSALNGRSIHPNVQQGNQRTKETPFNSL